MREAGTWQPSPELVKEAEELHGILEKLHALLTKGDRTEHVYEITTDIYVEGAHRITIQEMDIRSKDIGWLCVILSILQNGRKNHKALFTKVG